MNAILKNRYEELFRLLLERKKPIYSKIEAWHFLQQTIKAVEDKYQPNQHPISFTPLDEWVKHNDTISFHKSPLYVIFIDTNGAIMAYEYVPHLPITDYKKKKYKPVYSSTGGKNKKNVWGVEVEETIEA